MEEKTLSDEFAIRKDKVVALKEEKIQPYPDRYETTHGIGEVKDFADGTGPVKLAGRIISIRYFGGLAFGHILDHTGRIQFALEKKKTSVRFDLFKKYIDIGDFLGIEGTLFVTKTGEKTVNVDDWTLLSKTLRPLPEKWHGLSDKEQILRRRYLDLITSESTMERFKKRTRIIRIIRDFLDNHGFMEIDTPVLTNKASGALATPFVTHHNALDIDVYLRIAPETYLKRAIAGGFTRVYEFARSFRNEGLDPSHLPDFTLLECYAAYWNYQDNMRFTQELIKHLLKTLTGGLALTYQGTAISFEGEWPRVSFRDLILKDSGIDITAYKTKPALLKVIKEKGIVFERDVTAAAVSYGTLLDLLYKKISRPKIINPVFLIYHPIEVSPLARQADDNPAYTDRFQLVVNGFEIINAYSELVDPTEQRRRFEIQMEARQAGDQETMEIDEDFLLAMEHGMPPISGWGMGIDRLIALLTDAETLRDVVLFPLMRNE